MSRKEVTAAIATLIALSLAGSSARAEEPLPRLPEPVVGALSALREQGQLSRSAEAEALRRLRRTFLELGRERRLARARADAQASGLMSELGARYASLLEQRAVLLETKAGMGMRSGPYREQSPEGLQQSLAGIDSELRVTAERAMLLPFVYRINSSPEILAAGKRSNGKVFAAILGGLGAGLFGSVAADHFIFGHGGLIQAGYTVGAVVFWHLMSLKGSILSARIFDPAKRRAEARALRQARARLFEDFAAIAREGGATARLLFERADESVALLTQNLSEDGLGDAASMRALRSRVCELGLLNPGTRPLR